MLDGFATPEELGGSREEYIKSNKKMNEKLKEIAKKFMEQNSEALQELAKIEHKEMARELALQLRTWAQNEEMIDQYFTYHGKVCNEAADLLEELTK
jgi:predicted DNA-binding antitoxin AbrB/MazE fold protein